MLEEENGRRLWEQGEVSVKCVLGLMKLSRRQLSHYSELAQQLIRALGSKVKHDSLETKMSEIPIA